MRNEQYERGMNAGTRGQRGSEQYGTARPEYGMSRPWQDESWFGSPFPSLRRMMDEMSRWLGGLGMSGGYGDQAGYGGGMAQQWAPSVDCSETENELIITAEAPGVEQEDMEIYCTDDSLILRGETRRSDERNEGGYYRSERRYGRFERVLPLPNWVDKERAQASFRNGVLEIRLPKTEAARQQMRRIPVQGGQTLSGMKGGEAGSETSQQPQSMKEGQPGSETSQQPQSMKEERS